MKIKVETGDIIKIIGVVTAVFALIVLVNGAFTAIDMDMNSLQARTNGDYKLSQEIYLASKINSANVFKTFVWCGLISGACMVLGGNDWWG